MGVCGYKDMWICPAGAMVTGGGNSTDWLGGQGGWGNAQCLLKNDISYIVCIIGYLMIDSVVL